MMCVQGYRNHIIPKNKAKARFAYDNGKKGDLPNVKLSKRLKRVQSKIKDQVEYFKTLARNDSNRHMFNKDPVVYAKPPQRLYEENDQVVDDSYGNHNHRNHHRNASLRVRSPATKKS